MKHVHLVYFVCAQIEYEWFLLLFVLCSQVLFTIALGHLCSSIQDLAVVLLEITRTRIQLHSIVLPIDAGDRSSPHYSFDCGNAPSLPSIARTSSWI